ncbi:MAG: hypothetical protein Q9O74_11850 [Planctomycetota bacterium]|nr:hypothetical protein [Planctomycetota bacterium]
MLTGPLHRVTLWLLVCALAAQVVPGAFGMVLCQEAGGSTHLERTADECCLDTAAWATPGLTGHDAQAKPDSTDHCSGRACTDSLVAPLLITTRAPHADTAPPPPAPIAPIPPAMLTTTDPVSMLSSVRRPLHDVGPPDEPRCGLASTVLIL